MSRANYAHEDHFIFCNNDRTIVIPLVEDTGINLKSTSTARFSNTMPTKAIRACGNTYTGIEMHIIFINSKLLTINILCTFLVNVFYVEILLLYSYSRHSLSIL